MIAAIALLVSDTFLLGILIYQQEYAVLQLLLVSQVFLGLLLVPFQVRGETKLEHKINPVSGALLALSLVALAIGLVVSTEEFWARPSNFESDVKLLLTDYGDLAAVLGAATMGVALSAVSFLRGRS